MNYYLCASDLFVLPSLDEGNPIVMFEALGLGLPFIGTDVGGIKEIIKTNDYGYVIKPKNSIMLSEYIDKSLTKQWDKKKIIDYSKNFTWNKIGLKIEKIYKKVIS